MKLYHRSEYGGLGFSDLVENAELRKMFAGTKDSS
jgi:hypothetical protein